MRVLITGGAGFIGSHLADALIADGDEIYVLDDLTTGSIENIAHLLDHPRFHLVVDSVINEAVTNELVNRVEHIYHLAAVVGVQLVVESPVRTLETNLAATDVVLKQAHKFRKRVCLASTSEVYGRQFVNRPLRETDERIYGPTTIGRWSYAAAKAIDEFLGLAYHRERGLDVVVVRFFNTVGPRQTGRYGMVIPRFVAAALDEKPILVHGDGTQSRSFTHVLDAIWAIRALMRCPEASGEVFNVGNGAETRILDLAQRVKDLTGSGSEIRTIPYSEVFGENFEDMQFRTPCIDKLTGYTGYRPRWRLDDMLRSVIEYHQVRHTTEVAREVECR